MARTLLLVLALAVAGTGARVPYAEYAGARMPEYGADYEREHVLGPDLEPLDYKSNDDFKGHTERALDTDGRDTDSWQSSLKIHKRNKIDNSDLRERGLDDSDDFNYDDRSKMKSDSRFVKRRPRFKSRVDDINDQDVTKYSRSNHRRRGDIEDLQGIDDSDNKDRLEDFVNKMHYRTTTERVVRRRPRDKYMRRVNEEDEQLEREMESKVNAWRAQAQEGLPPRQPTHMPMPLAGGSDNDDEEFSFSISKDVPKQKKFEQYGDYYDMKRVSSMKDRLPSPSLNRRTQETYATTWSADMKPYRRLFKGDFAPPPVPYAVPQPTSEPSVEQEIIHITTTTKLSPAPTETDPPYTSTTTKPRPPIVTTRTTVRPTTSPFPKITNGSKELSIAEKSRLSILKKVQRKESNRGESTTKPPVLLHFTKKLATLAWIEPRPSVGEEESEGSGMQVVSADPPERLARVKALIRQKLVAGARSIHDLTDNWDELVCDYIDMSLVDRNMQRALSSHMLLLTLPLALLFLMD